LRPANCRRWRSPALSPRRGIPCTRPGAILSDGIALGHVVLHEPRVVINNYIAEDLPKEIKRLDAALAKLRADLDRMLERGDIGEGGEHRDVLEAYRMFANDHGLVRTSCMKLSAPASPRKPPSSACSPTPARACCARPILICGTACMTSRISATA